MVLLWLQSQGYADQLEAALLPILITLWTDAWGMGSSAAQDLAPGGSVEAQELQDMLAGLGSRWAAQIAETTLKILARALAAGGATAKGLKALLGDRTRGLQIAATEITRVIGTVATTIYTRSNIQYVRWEVHSANPCQNCLDNQAAGRWPLGVPFPSGDVSPPAHIRCECDLVPD